MSIAVRRQGSIDASRAAAASRTVLTRALAAEAELWIAPLRGDAIVLGAFGRAHENAVGTLLRRGTGGPSVRVGDGTLHVVLALETPASLVACDAPRIVNRYVRPLLRALTRVGAMAHYFGRDWISVKHRPAAWVGFAHDRLTSRAALEAFIALRTPFVPDEESPRASLLGKEPGTVEAIAGVAIDEAALIDAIVAAYASASGHAAIDAGAWPDVAPDDDDPRRDPPWSATLDEPIGILGAGPDRFGRFRVGGDLMISSDALITLENSLETHATGEDLARAIDAALGAPGVVTFGIRSLTSVRDVIERAREASQVCG